MSSIMNLSRQATRWSPFVAAALVLGLTFTVVRRAYAIVTVPNMTSYLFTTLSGGVSAGISMPVGSRPIHFQASSYFGTNTAVRGTGQVSLTYHNNAAPVQMSWSGTNALGNSSATTTGLSNVVGTDIVQLSAGTATSANALEIGPTVSQIRVDNDEATTVSTYITVTY